MKKGDLVSLSKGWERYAIINISKNTYAFARQNELYVVAEILPSNVIIILSSSGSLFKGNSGGQFIPATLS